MKKILSLIPVLLWLAQPVLAADDLISSQLADEARTWQQKDRDDLAAELWRKLLRSDPKHPEALVKLGLIEARAGNIAQAEALQNRAKRLAVAPAGLPQLSAALQSVKPAVMPAPEQPNKEKPAAKENLPVQKTDRPAVVEATIKSPRERPSEKPADKKIAKSADKKADKKRETESQTDKEADSRSAAKPDLDSLQTASAVNENWAETRRILEELARNNPGKPRYLFALTRHLIHREATRREAIRQLASMPSRGRGKREAREARETQKVWRQALVALDARAGDVPLFDAYLKRFPNDATISERQRTLDQKEPAQATKTDGASRLTVTARLDEPKPVAAASPSVNQTKATALLEQARRDEQASAFGAAAAKLESAMLLDPLNMSVRLALARQYQFMGTSSGAASLLDDLLATNPAMPEALQARAALYASQQKWLDGLTTLERIPSAQRTDDMASDQRQMWLSLQVMRARQLYDLGNTQQANALMEMAQSAARPDEATFALVAAGWADLGQSARGLRLMREMVRSSGAQTIATRIKYAEILQQTNQDVELSAVLRDLAVPGRLTAPQQEEVNKVILAYTLRLTEVLRESGRVAEAAVLIDPVMQRSDDSRVLLAMARIHRAASDPAPALALVEKAIVREPDDLSYRLLASELALAVKALDKADGHAKAALQLAPNHPRALTAAGRVEKARGNIPKALEYFQRAQTNERDKNAFAGAPGNLALRLLEPGSPTAPSAAKMPLTERSGLLPIPDAGPRGDRMPSSAYPVPTAYPEADLSRPVRRDMTPSPPSTIEERGRQLQVSTGAEINRRMTAARYSRADLRVFSMTSAGFPSTGAVAIEPPQAEPFGDLKLKLTTSLAPHARDARTAGQSL